jgi:hypothetical protein
VNHGKPSKTLENCKTSPALFFSGLPVLAELQYLEEGGKLTSAYQKDIVHIAKVKGGYSGQKRLSCYD